jgi:Fuc2NAc and GlcNAc transferase
MLWDTSVVVDIAVTVIFAFALSAWLTSRVRRFALSRGLLDVPNARSSHRRATPRGGGLAIVLASIVAWLVLAYRHEIPYHLLVALIGGGAGVAFIGFLDDRRPVPARVRFTIHVAAAIWALAWIGVPASLQVGAGLVSLGSAGWLLGILGIAWFLNLFNFMDGIDGIAASEATFVSWGGAYVLLSTGGSVGLAGAAVALGAACLGFLIWNWPPAKIFMGDVGSGYLGYVIGVLALASVHENPVTLWAWLILSAVFLVDATVTLVRRLFRGELVYQAHRSHAYQWLARRWNSHKRVTLSVLAINLLWLLPCAALIVANPRRAMWVLLLALAPLTGAALIAGAGRAENPKSTA